MCSSPSSFVPCSLCCQEKNNTGSFTQSSEHKVVPLSLIHCPAQVCSTFESVNKTPK